MAFSDKLKNLTKQAQEAVAEHKEKIHDAVDAVSVAADEKTHGKYTAKIAKFGQKTSEAVDKFSGEAGADETAAGDAGAASSAGVADTPASPAPAPASPSAADPLKNEAPSGGPVFDE